MSEHPTLARLRAQGSLPPAVAASSSVDLASLRQSMNIPFPARDGDCVAASQAVTEALGGFTVTVMVWVDKAQKILGAMHMATESNDRIIDFTLSQFGPGVGMIVDLPIDDYIALVSRLFGDAEVTLSVQRQASTKVAWGEDAEFTIVSNTPMTATKWVRWLTKGFNSAWVQPDGTVLAVYTHDKAGPVPDLLSKGWVRTDVVPEMSAFVQSDHVLTDAQVDALRIVVMQSGVPKLELASGLGDNFSYKAFPVLGPSDVTRNLRTELPRPAVPKGVTSSAHTAFDMPIDRYRGHGTTSPIVYRGFSVKVSLDQFVSNPQGTIERAVMGQGPFSGNQGKSQGMYWTTQESVARTFSAGDVLQVNEARGMPVISVAVIVAGKPQHGSIIDDPNHPRLIDMRLDLGEEEVPLEPGSPIRLEWIKYLTAKDPSFYETARARAMEGRIVEYNSTFRDKSEYERRERAEAWGNWVQFSAPLMVTALYDEEVDEGVQCRFDVTTGGEPGTKGYYLREAWLRAAGIPLGQIFTSERSATMYAQTVLRANGIEAPGEVAFVQIQGGFSRWDGGSRSKDPDDRRKKVLSGGRWRIELGNPTAIVRSESVLLHEIAHLICRSSAKGGSDAHNAAFAKVHGRLLWEFMGVSLSIPGLSPVAKVAEWAPPVDDIHITPKGAEITITEGPYGGAAAYTKSRTLVGILSWFRDKTDTEKYGEIISAEVDEQWQRQGIATAMFNWAKRQIPELRHSHALTDDGKAWSRTVAKVAGRIEGARSPQTTPKPIEEVQRGDAIRFTPFTKSSRIWVYVEHIDTSSNVGLVFVHGVRLNANGHQDSQSRRMVWPVQAGDVVEVEVEDAHEASLSAEAPRPPGVDIRAKASVGDRMIPSQFVREADNEGYAANGWVYPNGKILCVDHHNALNYDTAFEEGMVRVTLYKEREVTVEAHRPLTGAQVDTIRILFAQGKCTDIFAEAAFSPYRYDNNLNWGERRYSGIRFGVDPYLGRYSKFLADTQGPTGTVRRESSHTAGATPPMSAMSFCRAVGIDSTPVSQRLWVLPDGEVVSVDWHQDIGTYPDLMGRQRWLRLTYSPNRREIDIEAYHPATDAQVDAVRVVFAQSKSDTILLDHPKEGFIYRGLINGVDDFIRSSTKDAKPPEDGSTTASRRTAATVPSLPGNPPGMAWCAQCGQRVQHKGGRWVHSRPSPSGQPNDHSADPVAERPSKQASLSLEQIISVAEHNMERVGFGGKTLHIPVGHGDDPEYQAALQPFVDWVRRLTGEPGLRFYASDYVLNTEGGPGIHALTDGYNKIVVRPTTNELTVLHECAHVIDRSHEGPGGHTPSFARIFRRLIAENLSTEAAEMFWGIVGMDIEASARTAAYDPIPSEFYLEPDDRAASFGHWYHGTDLRLPIGSILTAVGPRRGTPRWPETYKNDPERANWVWVTDSLDDAVEWAEKEGWHEGKIYIYRVEPMDGPVRQYDPHSRHEGFVCPRARIVAEVEQFPRGMVKGEIGMSAEASSDTWYHWSVTGELGGNWIHAGTQAAAMARRADYTDGASYSDTRLFTLRLTGPTLNTPSTPIHDRMVNDLVDQFREWQTNRTEEAMEFWEGKWQHLLPHGTSESEALAFLANMRTVREALDAGKRGAIFYVNAAEDVGSVSVVAPLSQWQVVTSREAALHTASQIVHEGPSRLQYHYGGQVERIAIIDRSAPPVKPGWTYFTTEPTPDFSSRRRQEAWERGEGTTKRAPKVTFAEGSGTATEGTVAFLDYIVRSDSIFIAYMNVRDDQRRQGHARALLDWVYAKARSEGKQTVDWGEVFYPANRLYWEYVDRTDLGVETKGRPLDGRNASLAPRAHGALTVTADGSMMSAQEFVRQERYQNAWLHTDGKVMAVDTHQEYVSSYWEGLVREGLVRVMFGTDALSFEIGGMPTEAQVQSLRIMYAKRMRCIGEWSVVATPVDVDLEQQLHWSERQYSGPLNGFDAYVRSLLPGGALHPRATASRTAAQGDATVIELGGHRFTVSVKGNARAGKVAVNAEGSPHEGMFDGVLAWTSTIFVRGKFKKVEPYILMVSVQDEYQRLGLATEMLRIARQVCPDLQHSESLTDDGKAWMSAVGSASPKTLYTLEHFTQDLGERKERHFVQAIGPEGEIIGTLNWYGTTGMVASIDVEEEHSRQGIATAMWEYAQQFSPKPKHSADRTEMGDAWARSVGGPLPRRSRGALVGSSA